MEGLLKVKYFYKLSGIVITHFSFKEFCKRFSTLYFKPLDLCYEVFKDFYFHQK